MINIKDLSQILKRKTVLKYLDYCIEWDKFTVHVLSLTYPSPYFSVESSVIDLLTLELL